jgi:hypothetical protein
MGSLSESERIEIESHVSKTYDILRMIPWSKGLEQVPEIAYKHHEISTVQAIPIELRKKTFCRRRAS